MCRLLLVMDWSSPVINFYDLKYVDLGETGPTYVHIAPGRLYRCEPVNNTSVPHLLLVIRVTSAFTFRSIMIQASVWESKQD